MLYTAVISNNKPYNKIINFQQQRFVRYMENLIYNFFKYKKYIIKYKNGNIRIYLYQKLTKHSMYKRTFILEAFAKFYFNHCTVSLTINIVI